MAHETMLKFNYPSTLLKEYHHWVVLLRPKQVTLGSLVLACKEEATRMSEVSLEAFSELKTVTNDLEQTLQRLFHYDKINYLCLMMVDKHVHFHVLPRYATARLASGVEFIDAKWPTPPDVTQAVDLSEAQFSTLLAQLRAQWPQ